MTPHEAIPVLRVSDAIASAAWYSQLGFVEDWRHQHCRTKTGKATHEPGEQRHAQRGPYIDPVKNQREMGKDVWHGGSLEHFQAKWNHLATRKMRPNKILVRIR